MTTAPIERALQLADVAPGDLVVGDNVRGEARLDDAFVASVRERGVLEPIVAYHTDEHGPANPVVLYGKRRTLAAREAGLETVPVVFVLEPDEADRLVDQLAENDHREALTNAERVAAFQQLEAIGISAFEIAKRTATPVDTVAAALEVAGSRTAREAAEKHTELTIEQAAAIAEFDTDPDAVKALLEHVDRPGYFTHELQRRRDDRDQAQRYEQKRAELTEAGITVVDRPAHNDPRARPLSALSQGDKPLTEAKHRKCPGAAVYLQEVWASNRRTGWQPVPVCADFRTHGHEPLFGGTAGRLPAAELTEEERAAEAAKRREVIENNKAWAAAETVRRDWLRTFIGRKTAPKGTPAFLAAALIGGTVSDVRSRTGLRYARELLGVGEYAYGKPDELAQLLAAAPTDARALMLTLTVVLAAYEERADRDAWRSARTGTARYLRFLEANGYELSTVEQLACAKAEPK